MSLPKPYYEHAGITIYHADCREVLPCLGGFDLCLTDPPYGINAGRPNERHWRPMGASSRRTVTGVVASSEWDADRIDTQILTTIRTLSNHQIIWGGNYYADVLEASRCWLVWYKRSEANGQTDFADAELAWCSFDGNVRLLVHEWNGFRREGGEERYPHPTQKPLGVMSWCIHKAPAAQTILDPFMGSGTTLVAAKSLGRKAVGIEIEEKYCEIAIQRLAQDVMDFGEVA